MSEEQNRPAQPEKETSPIRPDPIFKEITRQAALEAGLQLRNVELPQLLLTDLLLQLPQDKDLSGTLFEFMRGYEQVSLEFKSENDNFNRFEFARTLARSFLFYAEGALADYSQLLTVFVCAKRPTQLLKHLAEIGTKLEKEPSQPWLLRCKIWQLEVVFVVCRLLPLEKPYYNWLMFAPASSPKWREFVKMLVKNREKDLLDLVRQMRPKEFNRMTINLPELLKDLSPEERAQYEQDLVDLVSSELSRFEKSNPQLVSEIMARLNPKTVIAGMTSQQRQELLKLLSQPDNQADQENHKPE
jgi:hypothetical protein